MLKNNKIAKFFMVMSMAAILSGPLFNANLSSRCNSLAGTASVTTASNFSSMNASDDLQSAWKIFDWKIWGYVADVAKVASVVTALTGGYDAIVGILHVDHISMGALSQQETAVLMQELD